MSNCYRLPRIFVTEAIFHSIDINWPSSFGLGYDPSLLHHRIQLGRLKKLRWNPVHTKFWPRFALQCFFIITSKVSPARPRSSSRLPWPPFSVFTKLFLTVTGFKKVIFLYKLILIGTNPHSYFANPHSYLPVLYVLVLLLFVSDLRLAAPDS